MIRLFSSKAPPCLGLAAIVGTMKMPGLISTVVTGIFAPVIKTAMAPVTAEITKVLSKTLEETVHDMKSAIVGDTDSASQRFEDHGDYY